jgi:hypothetical protein
MLDLHLSLSANVNVRYVLHTQTLGLSLLSLYLSLLDYPSHLLHLWLLFYAIFSPPLVFFLYLINPYSFDGKRQNLLCQRPKQQQRHESTTSRLVVGYADPDFRDLGGNIMSQIIGATHRRKNHVKKKHAANKTLGEWTRKQRDAPRAQQVGYSKHQQQPVSETSHTHRDFFGFDASPSLRRTRSL